MLKEDFPDALPEVAGVIHPGRGRGKVFMLEPYVTLESEAAHAAAEKKKTFRSVSTCIDVDSIQFDTTQAKQKKALKQVCSYLDGEGSDLAAPSPSGQRYGGRGPSQHEDQQEPSRPINCSTVATQREAQRSGAQRQHIVESKKQPQLL